MRKTQPKLQKTSGWKIGKWVLIAEGVAVLYAYSIFYKLNRYQEYRYVYHKKHPHILNSYYLVGEQLGGLETRQKDLEYWTSLESEANKPK